MPRVEHGALAAGQARGHGLRVDVDAGDADLYQRVEHKLRRQLQMTAKVSTKKASQRETAARRAIVKNKYSERVDGRALLRRARAVDGDHERESGWQAQLASNSLHEEQAAKGGAGRSDKRLR